ncbi:hypothetical protein B5C34_09535 [Pacificimonas flava]|uniref:Uncharacterized protein n=1 Tax=Pacificimonas flava TaxID=1234595 RepID=A0A219B7A8_9SPHN|nr:hypothetical protein B5C34_09535 [Pacificimonas flava]
MATLAALLVRCGIPARFSMTASLVLILLAVVGAGFAVSWWLHRDEAAQAGVDKGQAEASVRAGQAGLTEVRKNAADDAETEAIVGEGQNAIRTATSPGAAVDAGLAAWCRLRDNHADPRCARLRGPDGGERSPRAD